MNKTLIRKWINLLKSGKYSPCKGKLRIGNRRCAIGLLCEAYSPHNWEYNFETDEYSYLGETEGIPEVIKNLVPLSQTDWEKIIIANDLATSNFEEIANFVEHKLL